jgi:transposase
MLAALIAGEREPKVLAALARGRLRRKLPQLEGALSGQFTPHHARLIQGALDLIAPLAPQLEQLASSPGVETTSSRGLLAEIGTDMSRFGSASRLASWAGGCPGNDWAMQ